MCFSAEASFTMGTVLSVIGVLCLNEVRKKEQKSLGLMMIAMIPLLFGIQQYSEGIVWLQMNGTLQDPFLNRTAQMLFLFMAWVLWPVYIPISFYLLEQSLYRKTIFAALFLIGIGIFFVDVRFLWNQDVSATIVGRSIYYPASPYYGNFFYGLSTILPFFISSIRKLWIFGLCLVLSYFLAEAVWHFTFTSVFCFFAAASSLALVKILRDA